MSPISLETLALCARQATSLTSEAPRISVIVPVFNHADYLPACLVSIFEQQIDSMELVCIDDASTDPKIREILEVITGFPGIKVLSNTKNLGISESQNRAVAAASGEHLAFVDCDDQLLPGALKRMQQVAAQNDRPDYVFSDRRNIDNQGKRLFDAIYQMVQSKRGIIPDLTDRMIASHLKLLRRDSYIRAGGCGERFSGIQDWELALKIARFGRFAYVPEILYSHRHHAASVTTSDSRGQAKKSNVLRREHLETTMPGSTGNPAGLVHFAAHELVGQGWYCPEAVREVWQKGGRCELDARGPQSTSTIEFIIDFNSYFDRIAVDRTDVSAKVVGSLWSPHILRSPLHRSSV